MPGFIETLQGEALLLKTAYKREGLAYVLRQGFRYVFNWPARLITAAYVKATRGGKAKFTYQDKEYPYFYHSYNRAWENERAVEIPIIMDIISSRPGAGVLEIGNVLRHYFNLKHDVVDMCEEYPGVINSDIIDYFPALKYGLVVSISTFEHIGWDEKPRRPGKLRSAIDHILTNVLAPGGSLVATFPLGYNTEIDRLIRKGEIPFINIHCLKRINKKANEWLEVSWEEVSNNDFDASGAWCGQQRVNVIFTIDKPA